jgi:hypothetical protein
MFPISSFSLIKKKFSFQDPFLLLAASKALSSDKEVAHGLLTNEVTEATKKTALRSREHMRALHQK